MSSKALPRRSRKPSKRLTSTRTSFGESESVGVFESKAADAKQLTTISELKAFLSSKGEDKGGIDIRGRVVAQLGVFKDGRGEFNEESLAKIVLLGNAKTKGLKSNFKHKSMSDDNLGKHLGRDFDLHRSTNSLGVACVKSKHFVLDAMAMMPAPDGGGTSYGEYVAGLAISDPSAFSSSLTLATKTITQRDENQKPLTDQQGNPIPDIWMPTFLHSIDVVSSGAAVDDFLSVADDEEKLLDQATSMFLQFFDAEEITPEVARERLVGFADKVILSAFEKEEPDMSENKQLTALADAQKETNKTLGELASGIGALVKSLTPPEETPPKETSELSREDFITKATALCKAQGKPELLGEFLTKDGLTIDGVKDALLAATQEDVRLNSENDNQGGKKDATGGPSKKPWNKLTTEQVDQRLRAEYDENADVNETLKLSYEVFSEDRKIELGLAPESCPLLPTNGKSKAAAGVAMLLICLGSALAFGGSGSTLSMSLVGLVGMAVTANQFLGQDGQVRKIRRKVAANAKIYNGTFTFMLDGLISGVYAAGAVFGGVAHNLADNTGGVDGALETETITEGGMHFGGVAHTLTEADFEKPVYATDNYTLSNASANGVLVGTLKDIDDKGRPVVYLTS